MLDLEGPRSHVRKNSFLGFHFLSHLKSDIDLANICRWTLGRIRFTQPIDEMPQNLIRHTEYQISRQHAH